MTVARWLLFSALLFVAACGGSVSILPEPFTRERADGKIPVKTELIRAQVRAELSGMPEGEAKVRRWQLIEVDYHACRLIADKAKADEEKVFADCMAGRGYVYMYPIDAEQLHNDIEFEMDKAHRERIAAEREMEKNPIVTVEKRREKRALIRQQRDLDNALVDAGFPATNGSAAEVKRLIDGGMDVNAKNILNETLLHFVAKTNLTEIAIVLIKAGADIDAKESNGFTPLHLAAESGQAEIAHLLINEGADIDAQSTHRDTPLHWAGYYGQTEIALALIKAGAHIDAKNDFWETPLHTALSQRETETALVLIKWGANVFARTSKGETALDIAIRKYGKNSKIARVLREAMAKQGG